MPDDDSIADVLRSAMSNPPDAVQDAPLDDLPTSQDGVEGGAGSDTVSGGASEPAEAAPEASAAPGAPAAIEAPADWSLADREAFAALPPASQQFVMGRIGQAQQVFAAAAQAYQRMSAVEQLLAPRRSEWALQGLDDAAVVRHHLALSDYAAQKPVEFIKWFAQSKGVDLSQVVAPATSEFIDPELAKANERIAQLERQANEMRGFAQNQQTAVQQQNAAVLNQQIQDFQYQKDEKGALRHPYFNDVRGLMASFLGSGTASDLKTAYDMACRAHPDVFSRIERDRKAAEARDREKKEKEKAAAARRAGSSVTGKPGGGDVPPESDDLRDTLRHALRSNGAAGSPMI